ncbi:MAG: PaaI family thioesterase [Acidimicrobiales bacterium]|jgi:acyl-coenzyme A thioesterase PaaI-like protein
MTASPAMTAEQLQQMLDTAFPGHKIPYVVEEITATTVRMRQEIGVFDSRPGGTVSGPTLMALADCAAWMVIVGQIGPVALSVTTSLHIDFFRRPELVDLVAEGTLLKLGKRLGVAEVALYSVGNDDLVAKAQVTYSIPPR